MEKLVKLLILFLIVLNGVFGAGESTTDYWTSSDDTTTTEWIPSSTDIFTETTTSSTVEIADTTTTPEETTTTTIYPTWPTTTIYQQSSTTGFSTGNSCFGLLFVGEFTKTLKNDSKASFLRLATSLSIQVPNLQFGISQFGARLYKSLQLQPYSTFEQTVNVLYENYLQSDTPDGTMNYLGDPLINLYDFLTKNLPNKFAVLIMGEINSARDPTTAYDYAKRVASLNENIYVLDYTKGYFPGIWQSIIGNRSNHILNGTGLNFNQINSFFTSTLINDILIQNC